MAKEDYYRTLIIKADSQNDIEEVFCSLPNWSYNGIVHYGTQRHELVNNKQNAKVLFSCDNSDFIMSTNVQPIIENDNMHTVYSCGYDASENQALYIVDDILFDLCKEINNFKNGIELYCGIIPATND